MTKKTSISGGNLTAVAIYRSKALRMFFSVANPQYNSHFTGLSQEEVRQELNKQLEEIEKDSLLSLFGCIEAKFRIDYIERCENKSRDSLSRKFREHSKKYKNKIPLKIIFDEWKENNAPRFVVSSIKGAFKYRHWLAHGRYWTYKSQKYDFDGIFRLAQKVDNFL